MLCVRKKPRIAANASPSKLVNNSHSFRRHFSAADVDAPLPEGCGTTARQTTVTMAAGATTAARKTVETETVSGPYGKEMELSVREKARLLGETMEKIPPMTAKALDASH